MQTQNGGYSCIKGSLFQNLVGSKQVFPYQKVTSYKIYKCKISLAKVKGTF